MITYCTNIHPGESWEETFAALGVHIPPIKAAVSPGTSFPIGLRLSRCAAGDLAVAGLEPFSNWLSSNDCFVPTINGFPYGSFHGKRVKERVYLPDWRSPERVDYTNCLADLLDQLLPVGVTGSISTVPLGFKGMVSEDDLPQIKAHLIATLQHLELLRQRSGKTVLLALEPEPGCLMETTAEVCRFFNWLALPPPLSDLLGICYDCCHQAVEFENPSVSLAMLKESGVPIAKVQVSSALAVYGPAATLLHPFVEESYLHQVVIRHQDGTLSRYSDLPLALNSHGEAVGDEWRCHFHVPIFLASNAGLRTTRSFLEEFLPLLSQGILFEVETYTWEVLPAELRCGSVDESIARELCWLKEQLNAAYCCP